MALNKRKKSRQPTQVKAGRTMEDLGVTPDDLSGDSLALAPRDLYKTVKSRFINSGALSSLSETINKVSRDRLEVMQHIELFINQRPRTAELSRIAEMLKWWKENLNAQEKSFITYEELCSQFAIDHPLLVSAVAGGYFQASLTVAQLKVVKGMPEIVDAVVTRATSTKGGTRDAELALKVTGMLSDQAQVHITNNAIGQQTNTTVSANVAIQTPDFKSQVMSLDEMIRDSYESARGSQPSGEIIEGEVV